MDMPNHMPPDRSPRAPVFLLAAIEDRGVTREVKLRNISTSGALVEGITVPGEGSRVIFRRKHIAAAGVIAWTDGCFAGIHFDQPLKPEQLMRDIKCPPAPTEPSADLYRRPAFCSHRLSPTEQRWLQNWDPAA